MKATLKLYSLLLTASVFTVLNSFAFTNDLPLVEKKKTYSKSYTLEANELVTLENKFGEIKISTWDKNEVRVEVTMTAKGNTDERANYILDRLTIEDRKNSSGVYFRTDINDGDRKYKNETYKDEGFSINYNVTLPSRNRLVVSNEFGPTIVPDFTGQISINSKFGALTTGKLANNKRVNVEFGSAEIAGVSNGDLEIKFSRAIISNLDGSVKARFEHCSGIKINVDNNAKDLDIRNDFTTLLLDVSKSLSANFNISTNFGEFRNKTNFEISNNDDDDDDRGPKFKKIYIGKSGSGSLGFKIKSEFSTITVGHNLNMEIKEEKKGKKTTNI